MIFIYFLSLNRPTKEFLIHDNNQINKAIHNYKKYEVYLGMHESELFKKLGHCYHCSEGLANHGEWHRYYDAKMMVHTRNGIVIGLKILGHENIFNNDHYFNYESK